MAEPLFDMSQAKPISAQPLFDMSQAKPIIPPTPTAPTPPAPAQQEVPHLPELGPGGELAGLGKALRVMKLAHDYPEVRHTIEAAKNHPVLAKMITEKAEHAAPEAEPEPSTQPTEHREGPGYRVLVRASDGTHHSFDAADLPAVEAADPGHQIIGRIHEAEEMAPEAYRQAVGQ